MSHKYISSTGEYYFFKDFYIRIQEHSLPTTIGSYALIQSSRTVNTEKEFEFLKKHGLLVEISKQEFIVAFERANLILITLLNK